MIGRIIRGIKEREIFVPDLLVDNDTDGMGSDVEDATSLAVVELVRHALLHGTVALDVNDIAALEHLQVGREWDDTALSERSREEVARAAAVALCVRHFSVSLRLLSL